MRVVAGTAGGMRLEAPPGMDVRPAPEMARAAIFNILRDEVEGAAFLDLFAGTGAVGIEALSRGAARAVFVELSPKHRAVLMRNLEHTHLADRAEVLLRDALRSPEQLATTRQEFDIIYVGPPFPMWQKPGARTTLLQMLDRLAELNVLKPSGTLIVQADARDSLPETTPRLRQSDRRVYGRNAFSFYTIIPPSS